MQVVYAKQPFPESWTSAIFLAGPTPRDAMTLSWRPEALRLLEEAGYDGVVMVPEVEDGEWDAGADAYTDQVDWERAGLDMCDVILFWIPRAMDTMPGLTTNVEFGLYVSSGKIVLGAPEWAKSIRYLESALFTATGEPDARRKTLEHTVQACFTKLNKLLPGVFNGTVGAGFNEQLLSVRHGGERCVPLHIWKLDSFQSWYRSQVMAGNRLDGAQLLWNFTLPKVGLVLSWVLKVNIWIASEQRHKSNEYVFARTDISTVCLWHRPISVTVRALTFIEALLSTEIVLIREFRSSARTPDGMVHEPPGGSSVKPGLDPLQVASEEVHDETGLIIPASRFQALGSRQVAATVSAHHAHLFAAEVTTAEMSQAKTLAAAQVVNGVEEDSERTIVEVTSFGELLAGKLVDWSTLGMISQAIIGAE